MPLRKPLAVAQFDAAGLGYNSIDHLCVLPKYPEFGKKSAMIEYSVQGGGQTATACAALAKLGFTANYIGKFGSGFSGELARRSLEENGVNTNFSLFTDKCQNQIAVIWIDGENGERTITYTRGKELDIHPEELDPETVCSGKILMLDAHNIPAMIHAAKWANDREIPIVLDAERILPGIEELLDRTDYIITDQFFPQKYTGIDDLKMALVAMSDHSDFVAVTLGEGGVLAYVEGQFIHRPAVNIKCVDSTGAGDVFHAGFAAGLLAGFEIEKCLRLANSTAGLKCRMLGGRDGIPDMKLALEWADADSDRLKKVELDY